MKFPKWVENPAQSPQKIKSNRLLHYVNVAATHHHKSGSISLLAKEIGFSRAAIYAAIQQGEMSIGMASAIELAVGADVVSREMLCPKKSEQ